MKNIFFNIVIPTKNRANTLPLTIKTLINQNYGDYKIVIADNNSTDNTESIIKEMNNNKIIYRHSLPISGKVTTEDIRSYLENILSEFNHLVSVLLKGDKIVETTQILINQKIVGHA